MQFTYYKIDLTTITMIFRITRPPYKEFLLYVPPTRVLALLRTRTRELLKKPTTRVMTWAAKA